MDTTFHPEKGPLLQDLQPGDRFIGYYLLRQKQLEPFRDPAKGLFLTLILGDRSGQLIGRVWENAEETAASLETKLAVKIEGEVETYLDRKQIRVLRVRNAQEGEYDLRDMVPTTKRDPAEMLSELDQGIVSVTNEHLHKLLDSFFSNEIFRTSFAQAPAAKSIHHAYLGGLLEHVLEMLQICETVVRIYPEIDRDLLVTGAILHDLGKLREYQWDLDVEYSDEGLLIGHVVMTDEMVVQALAGLPDFPAELSLRLRHMLVSHHGKFEWGAPRRPQTLEAIALHHIENLDAQINRFHSLIESAEPGETWTPFSRKLGRSLYAGQSDGLSPEEKGYGE